MQFLKKTKQGNLHYILNDGRLGAVYPDTGYVRVSRSMNGFADDERSQYYKTRQRQSNVDAIKNGNTGNVAMYQINPQRKYDRYVVWDTDKYGRELYCKYTMAVSITAVAVVPVIILNPVKTTLKLLKHLSYSISTLTHRTRMFRTIALPTKTHHKTNCTLKYKPKHVTLPKKAMTMTLTTTKVMRVM